LIFAHILFISYFALSSLSRRLLNHKATKRLGVVKGGAKLIKIHSWFATLDWDALIQKQLRPPQTPAVRDNTDLSNFESFSADVGAFEPYVDDGSNWDADF